MNLKLTKAFALLTILITMGGMASASAVSVDEIQYQTNGDFFDGELFAITMVSQSGTGDAINVHLGSDQLSDEATGIVQGDIRIGTSDQRTDAVYGTKSVDQVYAGDSNLYDLQVVEHSESSISEAETWAKNNCFDLKNSNDYHQTGSTVWCVVNNGLVGNVHGLESPDAVFETEFEINTSEGNVETRTISNGDGGDGTNVQIGDEVRIEWEGSLSSGQALQDPNDERAFYLSENDQWFVIAENNFNTWDDYVHNGDLVNDLSLVADGTKTVDGLQSELDSKKSSAYSAYTDSEIYCSTGSGQEDILDYCSWGDGSSGTATMTQHLDYSIEYPTFTTYVNTGEQDGFVTIEKIVGLPEIVDHPGSTTSDRVQVPESGGNSFLVDVTNNADTGEAEIGVTLDCSMADNFESGITPSPKSVGAGETVSYEVDVSFSQATDTTGSCVIEADDSSSTNYDTSTVYLEGMAEDQCIPGNQKTEERSDGTTDILQCPPSGELPREIVDTCDSDEEAQLQKDSTYTCEPEGGETSFWGSLADALTGNGDFGDIPNPLEAFNNWIDNMAGNMSQALTVMSLAISMVAGIVTFSFLKDNVLEMTNLGNGAGLAFAGTISFLIAFGLFMIMQNPLVIATVGLVVLGLFMIKAL